MKDKASANLGKVFYTCSKDAGKQGDGVWPAPRIAPTPRRLTPRPRAPRRALRSLPRTSRAAAHRIALPSRPLAARSANARCNYFAWADAVRKKAAPR